MKDSSVLREIYALIDSYNWDSFDLRLGGHPSQIKDALFAITYDDVEYYGRVWLHSTNRKATYTCVQLMLTVLDHLEWQKEEKVLDQFSRLPRFLHRRDPRRFQFEERQIYRLLLTSLSRFKGYLAHHNARYRAYAALILMCYVHHSNDIINYLLVQLQRERSPRVIYHLLYSILHLFSFRQGFLISCETAHKVLLQVTQLLHAKHPLIRHISALLTITIRKRETSDSVLDILVQTWPLLPSNDWPKYTVVNEPLIDLVLPLGEERAFHVVVRLMSVSTTYAAVIWHSFFESDLGDLLAWRKLKGIRIAFTIRQKTILEAVLACDAFWKWKQRLQISLRENGFQETRAKFRQQLLHSYIVDKVEPPPLRKKFPIQRKLNML